MRLLLFSILILLGNVKAVQGQVLFKADEMPCWKGCEFTNDREACTDEQVADFVARNIRYPQAAIDNRTAGEVSVSFIVDKGGKITKPNVIFDIGDGCGDEALRLVSLLPDWKGGIHQGDSVKVIYTIDINFVLPEAVSSLPEVAFDPAAIPTEGDTSFVLEEVPLYEETALGRVYHIPDEMPYFGGCDMLDYGTMERRECSQEKLIAFIQNSLTYPSEAIQKGIEGVVYVTFVIDQRGNVRTPNVAKDIGGGCGEEALRLLHGMPTWTPGMYEGALVPVAVSMPIRFVLKSKLDEESRYQMTWGDLQKNKVTVAEVAMTSYSDILVRNKFGDDMPVASLEFLYQKGRRTKEAHSNGNINADIRRLLSKAKEGGILTVIATVQSEGELVPVERTFEIVE